MIANRNYNDRREEGETTLRQCQLVQLGLLHIVDAICKKHKIEYFLGGGTLLGAMRHNGFIPWDDDLDIGLMTGEYKRLLKVLRKELPDGVCLQTPEDCPHLAIPFAKVRDVYSFYGEVREDISTADPSGIYIDIFPYETMPDVGYSFQRLIVRMIGSMWMRKIYYRNKARGCLPIAVFYSFFGDVCAVGHGVLRAFVWCLKKLLPSHSVYIQFECGYTHRYDRSHLFPLTTHAFEDGDFPVPANADASLAAQYGNWREIPPEDKRPRHASVIDPFHSVQGSVYPKVSR